MIATTASMTLAHGLFASSVFFVGLFVFCRAIVNAAPASLTTLIYFCAVPSTSVSLAVKSPAFAVLFMIVRRQAENEAAEPQPDLSNLRRTGLAARLMA